MTSKSQTTKPLSAGFIISRRLADDLKAFLDGDGVKSEAWSTARALLVRLRESDV